MKSPKSKSKKEKLAPPKFTEQEVSDDDLKNMGIPARDFKKNMGCGG